MSETLTAELVLEILVACEDRIPVGKNINGDLGVIPIVGGTFSGKISGTVVAGGADWNTTRSNETSAVFAKYTLLSDDGHYISITNQGVLNHREETKIKTMTTFHVADASPYAWLNNGVYVGGLTVSEEFQGVKIDIYHLL